MLSDIETAIMSNHPLLYVLSPEEYRCMLFFEKFCIRKSLKMWVHTISEGMWNVAFSEPDDLWIRTEKGQVMRQYRDPIALLEHLKNFKGSGNVFLLLDFHETLRDALVRRMLKDLLKKFKESKNTIVILSSVLEIPESLKHSVCIQEYPLPTRKELSTALHDVIQSLKKSRLKIQLNQGDRERLVIAGQGLTMDQFENCLATAVVRNRGIIDANIIDEIVFEKKRIIKQSGVLEFFDTSETMEQVGGLSVLKQWLDRRQLAFTDKARAYGLPTPKGILLLGVQGAGKSLSAKACAALWKFPLLKLDTGRLFSGNVGSSEERTRQTICLAESISPCVLWIDEIEKALAGVASSSESDAGTTARVFASIATWLQEKSFPVFVIATANNISSLPPELIRKGRFDEIFFLDLPGLSERMDIFSIHLSKRNRNPKDFDLKVLGEFSAGFSGAEIEQAIIAGLYISFDEDRPLEDGDILEMLKSQVPLSKTMAEEMQALRSWAVNRAINASDDRIERERRKWRSGDIRKKV